MKLDWNKQLTLEDTEKMSEQEWEKFVLGHEFIMGRIKEFLSLVGNQFDSETRFNIQHHNDGIQASWTWERYIGCGDYEPEHETMLIPYQVLFSLSEEEQHKRKLAEEAARAEEARKQAEEEKRRKEAEFRIKQEERRERAELERLKQKYEGGVR